MSSNREQDSISKYNCMSTTIQFLLFSYLLVFFIILDVNSFRQQVKEPPEGGFSMWTAHTEADSVLKLQSIKRLWQIWWEVLCMGDLWWSSPYLDNIFSPPVLLRRRSERGVWWCLALHWCLTAIHMNVFIFIAIQILFPLCEM